MAKTARVTVTLPAELVAAIDRCDRNRSRFVTEAVAHELDRRRREGLLRSLRNPHPRSRALAEIDLAGWGASLAAGDEALVDISAGTAVRWADGGGWVEDAP